MSDDFFGSDLRDDDEDGIDPAAEEGTEETAFPDFGLAEEAEDKSASPDSEIADSQEAEDLGDETRQFEESPFSESPREKSAFFGEEFDEDDDDEIEESPSLDYFAASFSQSDSKDKPEETFSREFEEETEREPLTDLSNKSLFEEETEESEIDLHCESEEESSFKDEEESSLKEEIPQSEPQDETAQSQESLLPETEDSQESVSFVSEEEIKDSQENVSSVSEDEIEEEPIDIAEPPAFAPYTRGDWSDISDADGTVEESDIPDADGTVEESDIPDADGTVEESDADGTVEESDISDVNGTIEESDNSYYRVEEHTVTERTYITRTVTTKTTTNGPVFEAIPEPTPAPAFASVENAMPSPEPPVQQPEAVEDNFQPESSEEASKPEAAEESSTDSELPEEDAEKSESSDEEKDGELKTDHSVSSDLIRGHINTIILRSLYDGDKYGYEIIAEIERKSHNQYSLKQPSLYSALKRLEKDGYITSYWGGSVSGGRRKYFSLTDAGKEISERNQNEWEYSRTVIDSLISDKDFDFNTPPPSAVDMRVLRKSTSRVPRGDNEDYEIDEIDSEEPYDFNSVTETVTTETALSESYAAERAALEEERSRMEEDLKRREEMLRIREEAGTRREQELLQREFELEAKQELQEKEESERELKLRDDEIKEREEEIERLRREAEEREEEIERLRLEAEERERESDQSDEIEEREQEIERLRREAEEREEEIERLRLEAEEREQEADRLRLEAEEETRAQLSEEHEKILAEAQETARQEERERVLKEIEEQKEQERRAEEERQKQEEERQRQEEEQRRLMETARQEERERVLKEVEEQKEQERQAEEERQKQEEEQQRLISEAQETARQEERERVLEELEQKRAEAEKERERTEAAREIERLHLEAEARESKIAQQNDEIERAKAMALNADKTAQNGRIVYMEPFAQERAQYEDKLREQAEHFENIYNRDIANVERRVRAEDEEKYRQRERQMIHQNYINLIRGAHGEVNTENPGSYYYTPPDTIEPYIYSAKPEKEREYRSAIQRLFNSANHEEEEPAGQMQEEPVAEAAYNPPPPAMEPEQRRRIEQEPPAKQQTLRSHGGMDFYDLEMRAEQDGIKVSISNKRVRQNEERKDRRLVDKGKALFYSAAIVFVFCLILGSISLGLKNAFHIPIAFPIIIWGTGVVLLLSTGLLYVNHYGEGALRQTGNIIVNVLVAFALLVIVTLIVALARQIDFTDASQIMQNVVIPILFFLNIVIFGVCYYFLIRPRKDE